MRPLAVALALVVLMVPLAGCLPDQDPSKCTDWTLEQRDEVPHQADVTVRNERADTVCVLVRFSGTDVAKVPLQPAEEAAVPIDERTIEWPNDQFTVRAEEWNGDRWTTKTVDLDETPGIEITVLEDELVIETR